MSACLEHGTSVPFPTTDRSRTRTHHLTPDQSSQLKRPPSRPRTASPSLTAIAALQAWHSNTASQNARHVDGHQVVPGSNRERGRNGQDLRTFACQGRTGKRPRRTSVEHRFERNSGVKYCYATRTTRTVVEPWKQNIDLYSVSRPFCIPALNPRIHPARMALLESLDNNSIPRQSHLLRNPTLRPDRVREMLAFLVHFFGL